MLSTEDGQQDPAWSERQLGNHANTASVIESDFDDNESLVERSGTGIRAGERFDGRPLPGLLACSAQFRFVSVWENVRSIELSQDCQTEDTKQTWH